jgi:hypothetical protein
MRYIRALLILTLLLTSRRYREKWRKATERVSESNDAVEASLRRLDATDNGGKPKIRLV